jgi:hypothetical protein
LGLASGGAAHAAAPAGVAPPAAPPPLAADVHAADAVALDPAGLLLFSVSLDGLTLSEAMGAYGDVDDPLAPTGELTRLLEADVDVLPAEQRIVGRIGEARRPLLVDLKARLARIAGRDVELAEEDTVVTATEIYMRVSALEKLLPLKVEVSGDELALRLRATEPFPVQTRLARLAKRPAGEAPGADQDALKVTSPYAFASPPGLDVLLDGGLRSGPQRRAFRYDLRLAGDLFWSNVQGYVGSDEQGRASTARLLLQRRSVEGALLGPLHAREITAGDTYAPGLALGPRSVSGRGVSLSTAPIDQSSIFNRIDLRGDLPPGYDVELYVNDVLRSSTSQAVNGRYEFLAVPLSPGVNVLRIVTYGPRGERNEEIQVVNVGAALLRAGEARFDFGAVDQDEPVVRLRGGRPLIGDSALFARGGLRVVGAASYGVSDLLTVTGGAARVPQPGGGAVGVYTLGARTSLAGLATQADAAWDGRGGSAVSLGLAGAFRGVSGVVRQSAYRGGFDDENNLSSNTGLDLEQRSELTLDASLDLRGRILPVSVRVIRNAYDGGSSDLQAGARASTSVGRLLVSAGLEYQRQGYRPARPIETLSGYLSASTFRSYRWQLRSTLDYDLLPDFKARFLTLTIDRRLTDAWSMRFGLGQPLDDLDGWNLVLSSILATRYGDFALTGEYDNADRDWRIAAQWNFGLSYDPVRRGYGLTRTGPGSGGSVLFNAFYDENGDGIRQADERPAPNVALSGGPQRGALTGPDGRVLVTGLGAGPTAQMDVSLERVENASVSTPPSRLDLRPRPGGLARVDYPLRPTGGVVVKVELLREDGSRVALASVRLQLVAASGRPVEGVTEFDGTAVFDQTPAGRYHLRLDPRQAAQLRMRMLDEPDVLIRDDGDFSPDVVAQVRFEAPDPATTVARRDGG